MELVTRQTNLATEVDMYINNKFIIYKIFFFMHNLQNQCFSGENPLVVTDARCFMPWIASQYNMKLEKDYAERENCQKGTGNRDIVDQEEC